MHGDAPRGDAPERPSGPSASRQGAAGPAGDAAPAAPWWTTLVRDVLASAIVLALVGVFLIQPFRVEGSSMEPLLVQGERILVDKLSYRLGEPERFDVVVLRSDEGRTLVKRILGLPGETLEIIDGTLHVDGRPVTEPYLEAAAGFAAPRAPIRLGVDEYWVLGDNRPASIDSRRFGAVERRDIRGRAVFRYWPPSHAGRVGAVAPATAVPDPEREPEPGAP